jgi:hypothetical protein
MVTRRAWFLLRGPFLRVRQLKVMLRDLEISFAYVWSQCGFRKFQVFRRAIPIRLYPNPPA